MVISELKPLKLPEKQCTDSTPVQVDFDVVVDKMMTDLLKQSESNWVVFLLKSGYCFDKFNPYLYSTVQVR